MTSKLWGIATPEEIRNDMRRLADNLTQRPQPVGKAAETACTNCLYHHEGDCRHSHGPLVPNGDYCGGQVLKVQAAQTTPIPVLDPIDAAMLADKQSNGYARRSHAQAMRLQMDRQVKR